MANLNETDLWEAGIYQLEEDDPVLGGPTGVDNRAPRQLANRALYQRLRNVTPWDATFTYPANVAYVSYGGTSWKSVGESLNVAPGTDAAKWVRWGFTLAELNASLGDAVATHEAKPDPHQQYATDVALAAHAAAPDAHGNYVRHDAAQGLSNPQAAQARTNIGAEAAGTAVAAVQKNAPMYASDTGAANAMAAAFAPAIAALVDGMTLWIKAAATNTGAATLNVNGLGDQPVLAGAHLALQGGEIVAGGTCRVVWKANLNSFVLIECTGGALQAVAGTKSQHVVTLAQLVMGSRVKGLTGATVGAGFTTATFSAVEVLMRNPTTGASLLALTVGPVVCNIGTAGPAANGRDQAGAFGNNSWVHFWFITDGATVATLASASATAPTLPAGYIARAYIGAVRLGAGTLADVCFAGSRTTYNASQLVLSNGQAAVMTAVSVAAVVPPNALAFSLLIRDFTCTPSSGSGIFDVTQTLSPTAAGTMFRMGMTGLQSSAFNAATGGQTPTLPNVAQQYFYLVATGGSNPVSSSHHVNEYQNPNGGE